MQLLQELPALQCWRLGAGAEAGATGELQADCAAVPLREGPIWAALKPHTTGFGLHGAVQFKSAAVDPSGRAASAAPHHRAALHWAICSGKFRCRQLPPI